MATAHESERDSNEPPPVESGSLELEQKINELQRRIKETFSELIYCLDQRMHCLLKELQDLKSETFSKADEKISIEKEGKEISEMLSTKVKGNVISEIWEGTRKTFDAKVMEYTNVSPTFDYDFRAQNLGEIREMILNFGAIQSTNLDYTKIKSPKLFFGKSGEGSIVSPRALAVDSNERIFIADQKRHSIHVYSNRGNFLIEFGKELLEYPWGVCCSEDKVFVTDHQLHSVFSFNISTFSFIKRACSIGSRIRELNSPTSVNFDAKEKEIYVADYLNNRIAIFDPDLNFKRHLLENLVEGPICVNVTEKRVFILECRSPNFRSYFKDGTNRVDHYSIGKKVVIKSMLFFCVDSRNNLILSEYGSHCIRVINFKGECIASIGNDRLLQPAGICLSQAGDGIIVVTNHKLSPIHLY